MRIVFYNIRYGTGSGWSYHFPFPFTGFFRRTETRTRQINWFLNSLDADIICLVEVDGGSYRHRRYCQANHMASEKGWEHKFSCKYGTGSLLNQVPILSFHGNALLSKIPIVSSCEHHFSKGIKRTFLSVEFEDFHVILAHLSLGRRARKVQLQEIAYYCSTLTKPVILCGDLNLLHGHSEIRPLTWQAGLRDADARARPTFPCRKPRLRLDYLLASNDIQVENLEIPKVHFSDHLPLVCNFQLRTDQ